MSKKKANIDSVNPDSVRVIKQEEFKKLQIHFRNTKANRNILSIIGSLLMWVLVIPILLATFYVLSVSILSILEYFELIGGETFTSKTGILMEYLIEPLESAFGEFLRIFDVNTAGDSSLGIIKNSFDELAKSETYILIVSSVFLLLSLAATLFYGWVFVEEFSIMTGKAKNRKKAIWFNIFFVAPSLIFVTFLVLGLMLNQAFLFENTKIPSSEVFADWMKYSAFVAAGTIVVPTILLLLGKYKTSIYLKIEN